MDSVSYKFMEECSIKRYANCGSDRYLLGDNGIVNRDLLGIIIRNSFC